MVALILGQYHTPGDAKCGGAIAHNRDFMFIDHNRLGYVDGGGPGYQYIKDGGCCDTDIPRSWGPIITTRDDNTTCISTNLSGKNGQMKELEKACGVYVSWNCSRLNSGDYDFFTPEVTL